MNALAALPWFAELPALRFAQPIRCHGDTVADNLRIARLRLDRTAGEIREALAALRAIEWRYRLGDMAEDMLEDLEESLPERLDEKWFYRAAEGIRWEICAAEEIAKFEDESEAQRLPESPTWEALRALTTALASHGESIAHLRRAEAIAARQPC